MVLFVIMAIISVAGGVFCAIITPPSPRRRYRPRYRRKYKGLIGLADDMERARKRNGQHRGVMCGPGGVGARGGRRRR